MQNAQRVQRPALYREIGGLLRILSRSSQKVQRLALYWMTSRIPRGQRLRAFHFAHSTRFSAYSAILTSRIPRGQRAALYDFAHSLLSATALYTQRKALYSFHASRFCSARSAFYCLSARRCTCQRDPKDASASMRRHTQKQARSAI